MRPQHAQLSPRLLVRFEGEHGLAEALRGADEIVRLTESRWVRIAAVLADGAYVVQSCESYTQAPRLHV